MELDELKSLWQKLDSKLDNLGLINRRMIFESITNDRQKKLNWTTYQYLAGVIIGPFGAAFLIIMRISYFDWKILGGIILSAFFMSYSIIMCIRTILALRSIDLCNDPILVSVGKIQFFKRISNSWLKNKFIFWPLYFVGLLLIFWDLFEFDYKTLIFIIVAFIASLILHLRNYKSKKSSYDKLENDINELNEYLQ